MTRLEFESAARAQNERRDAEVAVARTAGSPCAVTPMLAFGGIPYCTAHRVMGPCPHGSRTPAAKGGANG